MTIQKMVVNPNSGKEQLGTVVDIVKAHEPFLELELDDGTVVRIKQTVTEVVRLNEADSDGNPVFNFTINATTNIYPPNNVRNPTE